MTQQDIHDLIAKQRELLADLPTETLAVVVAGELVDVEVTKLLPDEWAQLVADHGPRPGVTRDKNLGFNEATLPKGYPAGSLKITGEPTDQDTWDQLFSVLDSVHRGTLGTVMWGLNVYNAVKELQELGKARADQQSASPANRASRRAASKGGSPRPSRSTSTKTKPTPTE